MRFGDWRRGASVARQNRRLVVEWWGYSRTKYRVWRLGPVEFHSEIPF